MFKKLGLDFEKISEQEAAGLFNKHLKNYVPAFAY